MSPNILTVTTATDREIIMTRVFNAPRRLVFEACTRCEHMKHWFGPRGWTLPECKIDFRAGGAWRWVLSGPGGRKMGMNGVFQEIAAPELFVTTESFDDYPGESVNTLTFIEQDGKTTLTVRVVYESAAIRDAVLKSGMQRGAGEAYDRLAEHLETMAQETSGEYREK